MTRRAVILDANLAVLFFVGLSGRGDIRRHRRLQGYTDRDFALVADAVEQAAEFLVSPNVLAETSNLIRTAPDTVSLRALEEMAIVAGRSREIYVESRDVLGTREYHRLGLTDAVLFNVSDDRTALFTADEDLYQTVARAGKNVVNFKYLRAQARVSRRLADG